MKWRHLAIYLAILLLAGGYFYYFEVVKEKEKQAEEKQARKVFNIEMEQIRAVEISSQDKPMVQLRKDGAWKIVEPIHAQVDQASLDGLLNSILTLERDRNIPAKPEDFRSYGLQEPPLKVRFQVGEQWVELQLGDKTPVGGSYYAMIADKPEVFLVPQGVRSALGKGLDELRKRELFTYKPEEVIGIQLSWGEKDILSLERQGEGSNWTTVDQSIKIKNSKVDNILDQIRWLRVKKFPEDETKNLESYGLANPDVRVKLLMANGQSEELTLGKIKEGEKQVAAISSGLPGVVVEVGVDILGDLPADIHDLEDRSLFTLKADEITGIKWQMGSVRSEVDRLQENKWGWNEGGAKPKELKNSWLVQSLLYDLEEGEYQKKIKPMPDIPASCYGNLEFWRADKKSVTIQWERIPDGDVPSSIVWVETDGAKEAVQIKTEVIRRIEDNLNRIYQQRTENPS